MKEEIKIKDEEIVKYCKDHNDMPYYSVSAKNNDNVEEGFSKVGDLAFERYTKNDQMPLPEIKPIQIIQEPQNRRCC